MEHLSKKTMSNKQSSIEWLFHKLWDTPKDKLNWYAISEQAKAMHKQEMVDFAFSWSHDRAERIDIEEDYNETFGGNNDN